MATEVPPPYQVTLSRPPRSQHPTHRCHDNRDGPSLNHQGCHGFCILRVAMTITANLLPPPTPRLVSRWPIPRWLPPLTGSVTSVSVTVAVDPTLAVDSAIAAPSRALPAAPLVPGGKGVPSALTQSSPRPTAASRGLSATVQPHLQPPTPRLSPLLLHRCSSLSPSLLPAPPLPTSGVCPLHSAVPQRDPRVTSAVRLLWAMLQAVLPLRS